MPINPDEWFRAMREIEAARKAGHITADQAKKLVLEAEKAYTTKPDGAGRKRR